MEVSRLLALPDVSRDISIKQGQDDFQQSSAWLSLGTVIMAVMMAIACDQLPLPSEAFTDIFIDAQGVSIHERCHCFVTRLSVGIVTTDHHGHRQAHRDHQPRQNEQLSQSR